LVSDGKKPYYFDSIIRKKIIKGKLKYEKDSHTSIADYYGFKGKKEDSLNKYEYNPLTKVFIIDQLNTVDDSKQIKEFCDNLDFTTIVPELIIKPIINPFNLHNNLISEEDIKLLKEWVSVGDSVRDSVWDSVWDSVRDSVWVSVRNSVRASVRVSVRVSVGDSVRVSVRNSVWVSVRDSVRDSVWDSVLAYISSFFNIKYKYDFSPVIKLWEKGLVPSFDGKTWRLHGENGKIVWEGKI
jgi:hypothetical protein